MSYVLHDCNDIFVGTVWEVSSLSIYNCKPVAMLTPDVIALSHIHVSAAYRSRIYENVDTPRSEPYFARETYVPRTCDVPATFPWRIRDVSVFAWNFTFVCMAYQCVCATYV